LIGCVKTSQDNLAPVVLLSTTDPNPNVLDTPILQVDEVREILEDLAADSKWRWQHAIVRRVPEPELRAASGDRIHAAKTGTAGAKVRWGSAPSISEGILTAGHVVGSRSSVSVGGSSGNVVFTHTFIGTSVTPEADVAVIELASTSSITSASSPSVGAFVDILTPSGPKTTQVIGKLIWLHFPGSSGTAGEVYLTYPGVTSPGDSGAPAVINGSVTEVIGHLIGGSGATADYIQDINYQLNEVQRLGGSGLSGLSI
jgi:hypothetical protein